MLFKEVLDQLNISAQCKKYNLSLWQCPQFLFLIMGIVIIVSALTAYNIGTRHIEDPLMVSLIVLVLVAVLFVLTFVITQGYERLAEANRMKSEFISVATHQLRSPLSNLRWVIELLMSEKSGQTKKEQTDYFGILKENINRMQDLISELLTVSRIEAAKLPVRKKDFSLKELIEDLISEYRPFIEASNVKISFNARGNLPQVFSDPLHLRLVIENLLDNAIRYIKDRGRVEIELFKKGKNICFSIKDTGVGIPEMDKKYIFRKFFRSRNVLKYQTQGAGLGLYISKAIIKRLGGKIFFKSKEGVGSTFWFTLPIKK